jgi:hypothetical protein
MRLSRRLAGPLLAALMATWRCNGTLAQQFWVVQ